MKKLLVIIAVIAVAQWWFKDSKISVPSQVNGADVSYSYIVKYSGGGGRGDTLPMLIALHGNGDTTKGFYKTALDEYTTSARIVLIKAPIPYGRGSAWPIAPDIVPYGTALNQVVEKLKNKYPTRGKPILLGFSGGGIMAYYQAVQHGNDYSYIFPVSGRLVKQDLGNNPHQPSAAVHAFHGGNDSVVSFSGGKKAVSILKSHGVTVQFTKFDGGHHGIFVEMKTEITQAVEEKLQTLY